MPRRSMDVLDVGMLLITYSKNRHNFECLARCLAVKAFEPKALVEDPNRSPAWVWTSWQYISPNKTMTIHNKMNLILHRPSRRINRVALSAAPGRVDRRKHATAGTPYSGSSNLTLESSPTIVSNNCSTTIPGADVTHCNTTAPTFNRKSACGSGALTVG
jgi:hypothetical protein